MSSVDEFIRIRPEKSYRRDHLSTAVESADRIEIHRDMVILSYLGPRTFTVLHINDFPDAGLDIPGEKRWP